MIRHAVEIPIASPLRLAAVSVTGNIVSFCVKASKKIEP